ncbi:unnamed protein product [Aphanomyces euteiches]
MSSIVVAACSKVTTKTMKTRTVGTKTWTTIVKTTIAAEMARPEFGCMDNRDQNIKTANEFGFVLLRPTTTAMARLNCTT